MKKLKGLIVCSALALTTVGVFAAKSKFTVAGLYVLTQVSPAIYVQIDAATSIPGLTESNTGNQVQVQNSASSPQLYPLFVYDAGYKAVISNGF